MAGLVFLCLSLLLFFLPVFSGRVFFFRDICTEIVPKRSFWAGSGLEVLWNPYLFFGLPTAANMQSSVFYPLNFMFRLGAVPSALSFYIVIHFAIALFGAYVLSRALGLSPVSSTAASIAFGFSGFLVSCGNQVVALNSAAWVMLLLWAALRAVQGGDMKFAALSGLFWGLQVLGGEPEIVYLTGIALVFFLGALVFASGFSFSAKQALARSGKTVLVAAAVGATLSCVQWLLTQELAGISNRAGGLSLEDALKWSLDWKLLTTVVLPHYIVDLARNPDWPVGFRSRELPYLLSVYAGVSALMVSGFGVLGRRRLWLAFILSAGFFALLSLGRSGGLYVACYHFLPGFNRFRIPERCMFGFAVFFSIVAGLGMEALSVRKGTLEEGKSSMDLGRLFFQATALALVLLAALLYYNGWSRVHSAPGEYFSLHQAFVQLSLARVCFFAGVTLCALNLPFRKSVRYWLLALLIFLDLFVAHRHVLPVVEKDFYSLSGHIAEGLPRGGRGVRALVMKPKSLAERTLGAGDDVVDFYKKERLRLQPFTGLEIGLRDAGARSSFYPAMVDEWLGLLKETGERLLALSGVQYVIYAETGPEPVKDPLPRAFMVAKARWVPDHESALRALEDPNFNPREEVILEGSPSRERPPELGWKFYQVRITRDDNQRVEMAVEPGHPGYLVFLDSFYPGWRAYVNGEEVPLYRADGFFRAVPVGLNGGSVKFVYWPSRFFAGLGVSLAAAVCLALIFLKEKVRLLWWAGFFVLLVVLPMWRGGTTYMPVTILRVLVFGMAGVWALRLGSPGFPFFYRTRLDLFLLGFWLVFGVSTARSPFFFISFYWYLNITAYMVLFYLALQFVSGESKEAKANTAGFFTLMLAGALLESGWAVVEAAATGERASAGFFNPAFLAGALLAISPYPLCRALFEWRKNESRSFLSGLSWFIAFLVLFAGLVATQSRAIVIWPLACAAAGLPGLSALLAAKGLGGARPRRRAAALIAAGGIVAAVALAAFPNPMRTRIVELKKDPYAFERPRIWLAGLRMIKDQPFGVGPGMFKYHFYRYKFPVEGVPAGRFEKRALTAHNEYIHLAAELSPLGSLLLVVPAAWLVILGFRRGPGGEEEPILLGAAGGLLAIMVHGLFDSNLHNPSIAVISAVLAALLYGGLSRQETGLSIPLEPGGKRKFLFQALAALFFFAAGSWSVVSGFRYHRTFVAAQERDLGLSVLRLSEAVKYADGDAVHFKRLANALLAYYRYSGDVRALSQALRAAQEAISLNPVDPVSRGLQAEILLELARKDRKDKLLERTEAAYQEALARDPFNVDYLLGLAEVKKLMGDFRSEAQLLSRAIELEPYDLPARALLAEALFRLGRKQEARKQFQELLQKRDELLGIKKNRPEYFTSSYRRKRLELSEADLISLQELLRE